MTLPNPSLIQPRFWMKDFLSMLMKRLGGLWFVVDSYIPAQLSMSRVWVPSAGTLALGYVSGLSLLCMVFSRHSAGATCSISSLPGCPVPSSVVLPVIPITFFESFYFSSTTLSGQLINMVIIQEVHIKAKLSCYSSFHVLLSWVSCSVQHSHFVCAQHTSLCHPWHHCSSHYQQIPLDCWDIKHVHLHSV